MEIVLYITILGILSPFVAYALATVNIFFTFLESGNIKYIYHGDTLWRIIADVKGKKLDPPIIGHVLVPLTEGEEEQKKWWEKLFGIYWIGIPPFASIKRFKITRRIEEEELAGKPMDKWIRDLKEVEVDSLRALFPRPFLLERVELSDRQTVNVLVVAKFEVVNAYTPVVELKGGFFELTSSLLQGAIIDTLKSLTMETLISAEKESDEEKFIFHKLVESPDPNDTTKGLFNQNLQKLVGLHLVGITMPEWDPSDTTVRNAMNLKFIAEKQAEATKVEATAHATNVGLKTVADAKRIKDLGDAQEAQIRAVVAGMAATGATQIEVLQAVTRVLEMEAATSPTSKLTTLVGAGGAQPVIPIGGRQ